MQSRAATRRAHRRSYPVLRTFHEWLEGREGERGAAAVEGAASSKSGELVGTADPALGDEDDPPLGADDEASVEAIQRIVQQLFREDEVRHTSEVTGVGKPEPASQAPPTEQRPTPSLGSSAEAEDDFTLPLDVPMPSGDSRMRDAAAGGSSGGVAKAEAVSAMMLSRALAAGEKPRPIRYELVPDAAARARAAEVTHALGEGRPDDTALITLLPDWTEEDPELPPAFQNASSRTG